MLVPRPGIILRPGGPPKVTEPTLSTATTRTGRCHSAEVPGTAHQRPGRAGPTNSTSSCGNCLAMAGAVVW